MTYPLNQDAVNFSLFGIDMFMLNFTHDLYIWFDCSGDTYVNFIFC